MNFASVKAITIPEGVVKKITSGNTVLWEAPPVYKNWVPFSTDASGNIYNGLGYKVGYRIRSGGAESAQSNGVCTGFIPFKPGDTLRIIPAFTGENVTNAINFADESFANLGQVTDYGAAYGICINKLSVYKPQVIGGASTLTLTAEADARIRYVRITHITSKTNGADLIVTVNEEVSA